MKTRRAVCRWGGLGVLMMALTKENDLQCDLILAVDAGNWTKLTTKFSSPPFVQNAPYGYDSCASSLKHLVVLVFIGQSFRSSRYWSTCSLRENSANLFHQIYYNRHKHWGVTTELKLLEDKVVSSCQTKRLCLKSQWKYSYFYAQKIWQSRTWKVLGSIQCNNCPKVLQQNVLIKAAVHFLRGNKRSVFWFERMG